ncbi:hypothetical protein [Streptomyces sp. NPDC049915]|uniref:hypothetical protein n=1 Tax=Streptomyces sp. NPDC049915 TaxID=3155510 RepID=UPI0034478731
MAGRTARWGAIARCAAGAGLAAVWWWAVLRLALSPAAGALEGAVAVGGWGLSLLPVHCVPKGRAAGAVRAGRWREAWGGGAVRSGAVDPGGMTGDTPAAGHPRSGEESGP